MADVSCIPFHSDYIHHPLQIYPCPGKEQESFNFPGRTILRYSGIAFSFLLLIIAIIHSVGTTSMYFKDASRINVFSKEPEDYREISVRVWYPAVAGEKEQSLPYMKQDEAKYMSQFVIGPKFILSHFNLVKTHSFLDRPPLTGSFPVILYSPSGDMVQNTVIFQELASSGYVVISVGHPYWNAFYYGQNGQVLSFDKTNDYYQAMWEEESSDTVNSVKEMITTAKDLNNKRFWQKNLNQVMPLEVTDIKLWSEDLSYLLDQKEGAGQELT